VLNTTRGYSALARSLHSMLSGTQHRLHA